MDGLSDRLSNMVFVSKHGDHGHFYGSMLPPPERNVHVTQGWHGYGGSSSPRVRQSGPYYAAPEPLSHFEPWRDSGMDGPFQGAHPPPEEVRTPRTKPPPVPSTAVYVKNLSADLTPEEIEDLFRPFVDDGDSVLVVPYLDRGIAFVDLGSTDAVLRAVAAAKAEGLRGRSPTNHGLITVEPSKKPVRASGLRAMNVRKRSGEAPSHLSASSVVGPTGLGSTDGSLPAPTAAVDGQPLSPSVHVGVPCWVLQETRLFDEGGDATSTSSSSSLPEQRIVAVFLDKVQAVAAACALWEHMKSALATPPSGQAYTYQEIREDATSGTFVRRVATGNGPVEVRQVSVEAPAYLNPQGAALAECCSIFIGHAPEVPQLMTHKT